MRSPKLVTRKGAVLFHRLGPLDFGEQSRWSRAPEKKGMWAFPYPLYDTFFTWHKYEDALPKHLKQHRYSHLPIDPKWCYSEDKTVTTPITREFLANLEAEATPQDGSTSSFGNSLDWPEWLYVREEFHEERSKWINNVGRKIVPIHKFWYSGDLYTHFTPTGNEVVSEWHKMDTSMFVKNYVRTGGTVWNWQGKLYRSSVDHLEVFIPPGVGQISGRISGKITKEWTR